MNMNQENMRLNFLACVLLTNQRTEKLSNTLGNFGDRAEWSDCHHEIFEEKKFIETCPLEEGGLQDKHRAFMLHLTKVKETLQEFGAEEDVKLLTEIETQMAQGLPGLN